MASKKLRNSNGSDGGEAAVDMSPMIDMVFLLLIFFIVNATAIIVQTDPAVRPPVAASSKRQEDNGGRIVINVRVDGTYSTEKLELLANEDDIAKLVKQQKEIYDTQGITPKLHLRGDENVVFKHSRSAIRAAASVGVDQVVFAVFQSHKGLPARK